MKRLLLLLNLLIGSVAANAQLVPPSFPTQTRFLVTYPLTYYVSPTGSDLNPCTSDSPCATAQAVYTNLVNSMDIGGQTVTIQFADGTYNSGVVSTSAPLGGGTLLFQGNASDNTKVVFSCTTDCWHLSFSTATIIEFSNISTAVGSGANEYYFYGSMNALLSGVYLTGGGHFGVYASNSATATFDSTVNWNFDGTWSGLDYLGGADGSVVASFYGGVIKLDSSHAVTNTGATFAYFVQSFGSSFVTSTNFTYTLIAGAYTGKQYYSAISSMILTTGGCPGAYFPGPTAGVTGANGLCL